MRPGKRQNLRSAIAVAAVSLLGVLMSGPLAWEAPDTLSFRARYTLVGPGALLVVASAVHVDAVRRDGFCCLWAAITLGFLCWPLCLVPFAGMSVAGLWKLACRHPDLAQREIDNFGNMLNTASCEGGKGGSLEMGTWRADWRLWLAWLGSILVFSMANALLASALPARKEMLGFVRQNKFREKIARRKREESMGAAGVAISNGSEGAAAETPRSTPASNFRYEDRASPQESPSDTIHRYQQQIELAQRQQQQQQREREEAAAAAARLQSSRPAPTSMGGAGAEVPRHLSRPASMPSVLPAAQAAEMERLRLQLAHATAERDAAYSAQEMEYPGGGGHGGGGGAHVGGGGGGGEEDDDGDDDDARAAAELARRSSVAQRMARLSHAAAGSSHHVMPAAAINVRATGLHQSMPVQRSPGANSYARGAPPPPSSSGGSGRTPPAAPARLASASHNIHRFD